MGSLVPVPSQSDVQTVLRGFLTAIMPSGVEIIAGIDNRVPEPSGVDFVIMTPIARRRIETNKDAPIDVKFTGYISDTALVVTDVSYGSLQIGSVLFGVGVAPGTTIIGQSPLRLGIGVWEVSIAQTVLSGIMAAGYDNVIQPTEITFQLDVHGPNSADNAQTISTLFRDQVGYQGFINSGIAKVTPLYADDPLQTPFINAEQQYEMRWVVTARVQADQLVGGIGGLPLQFADSLTVTTTVFP